MNKGTLSKYGWVVILLLILAVLISLATPFASEIKNSISKAAIDMAGVGDQVVEDLVDKYGSGNSTDAGSNDMDSEHTDENEGNADSGEENESSPTVPVSAPTITIEGVLLIINDAEGNAEKFNIYDGDILVTSIVSTGSITKYDLSVLSGGSHQIGVVATARNMLDSEKVELSYVINDYATYKPSALLNFQTLTIQHDNTAEYYEIRTNGIKTQAVQSLGKGRTTNVSLVVKLADIITVQGYKNDKAIGLPLNMTAECSDISIQSLTFNVDQLSATSVINNWNYYYKTDAVQIKIYLNDTLVNTTQGSLVTEYQTYDLSSMVQEGDELKMELLINNSVIDTQTLEIVITPPVIVKPQLPSATFEYIASIDTIEIVDVSGLAEAVVVSATVLGDIENEWERIYSPGYVLYPSMLCLDGTIYLTVVLQAPDYADSDPASIKVVVEGGNVTSYKITDSGSSGTIN